MNPECVFCGSDATATIQLGIRELPVCDPHEQSIIAGVGQ